VYWKYVADQRVFSGSGQPAKSRLVDKPGEVTRAGTYVK
jgi:hypothetical protein